MGGRQAQGASAAVPTSANPVARAFFTEFQERALAAVDGDGVRAVLGMAHGSVSIAAPPDLFPTLTRALSHLPAAAASRAGLTVTGWGGPGLPMLPWSPDDEGHRGVVGGGFSSDGLLTVIDRLNRTLTMFDRAAGEAVFWSATPASLPSWEWSSPLRAVLAGWLSGRGLQLAHAGAVGQASRGVLLGGAGGSGKSTTALACLLAGLDFLADDYLGLDPDGRRALSVYSSAKLDGAGMGLLPGVQRAGQGAPPAGDKAVVYVNERWPAQLAQALELRAVVLPEVRPDQATRLEPAGAAAALRAIAPSTIFQLPGAGGPDLARIATALRGLPAHRLILGASLEPVPGLVAGLLG